MEGGSERGCASDASARPRNAYVTLTSVDFEFAVSVGVKRNLSSLRRGKQDAHGCDGIDGWTYHIEGACGEAAFATWRGLPWTASVDAEGQPDFAIEGFPVDVKTRPGKNGYTDLIVREERPDDWRFVLLVGRAPTYRVAGWVTAKQARERGSVMDPGGRKASLFIPERALNPWETL